MIVEAAAFEDPASLLFAPWRMDTSKLLERKLFNRLRFCSAVFPDQLDLLSSRVLDPSSPHRLISVADEANELRIDIRSVLEHTMPETEALVALGTSEARLRIEAVGDTEGAGISEKRRFGYWVYRWVELLPSSGWISHTCSVDVLYIFNSTCGRDRF